MPLPFIDLQAQLQRIQPRVKARIERVLEHGRFVMGPEVTELEAELAAFCHCEHVLVCSSGTDALLMALMALDIGPQDAVFTSPFSFVATAEVIALLGATPVFVDIDPRTYALDPWELEKAVQAVQLKDPSIYPLPRNIQEASADCRPRAVIPVDLFGCPADYAPLQEVAGRYGLKVIEDAAQSFGAEYHGHKAGTLGTMGCTSFFPAKPLGGYGDGGAVFTNDSNLCKELASLRVHGQGESRYSNRRIGLNARLDTLQAAILLAKLEIFPEELQRRQAIAQLYTTKLLRAEVSPPEIPAGRRSAWAQYTLQVEHRDDLVSYLSKQGIPTNIYYPIPLHLQEAFSFLGYRTADMPVSEHMAKRVLSLPMHPYLTEDQVASIASAVHQARPSTA